MGFFLCFGKILTDRLSTKVSLLFLKLLGIVTSGRNPIVLIRLIKEEGANQMLVEHFRQCS